MMKKTSITYLMFLLMVIFFLANAALVLGAEEVSNFSPTGSMGTAREEQTATLLPNGKVLIAGGANYPLSISLSSTELYDPATGTFTSSGSMGTARVCHTATLLASGKVLIAGGFDVASTTWISSAEVYDPATGTFSQTGSMLTARRQHTATLLANGKVLIAAGSSGDGLSTSSSELYDPETLTFTSTGSMGTMRGQHTATLLPSGKVLITGGGNFSNGILASAELYDPTTETFTITGSLAEGRYAHTATLLPSGNVLIAGGYILGSVEIYNPTTETFTVAGSLTMERAWFTATLLTSGKVLIAGGYNNSFMANAEQYDPSTGTSTVVGSLVTGRWVHTETLLLNGKVLIAGGLGLNNATLASAELYWDPTNVPNHTVTFIEGANGTISGSMIQTVTDGGNSTPVQAVPNNGYTFDNWTGTEGFSSTDNPLTVNNVTADMTITANFKTDQIEVLVDVKPGETPNSINPRSKGKIPVAIIAAFGYSANDIDPTTVRFGKTGNETYASHWSLADINNDGQLDLLLHFPTENTGIFCGDTIVFLTGKTRNGVSIKGEDDICTVGCK